MSYRQYDLQSGDSFLTCWLEHDAKLKENKCLTLKETGARVWRVSRAYSTELQEPPTTKWQVGGLI